jgi:predicted nucleic acid-binding protein
MKFFWDTFAFVELIEGNEKLVRYAGQEGITAVLNVYELVSALLRTRSEAEASFYAEKYWPMLVGVTMESLIEAAKFMAGQKKRDLSYADALGYILALRNGAKFLTGDVQFSGMPNVEFIR